MLDNEDLIAKINEDMLAIEEEVHGKHVELIGKMLDTLVVYNFTQESSTKLAEILEILLRCRKMLGRDG